VLLLLPPSETKRDGGSDGSVLTLSALGFSSLTPTRKSVLAATRQLARSPSAMAVALRLGPAQNFELVRNQQLVTSPTMPALERYTGVLYDALDAQSLGAAARQFADAHLVIHSALFGLLRASDSIPAYRLSHNSRLPAMSLKSAWRDPISGELARHDGLVLDLRSEAYADLGPAPGAFHLRIVARGVDGQRRALTHFNKKGKGDFIRAVLRAGRAHDDVTSLLAWASESGIRLGLTDTDGLQLEVDEIVASRA